MQELEERFAYFFHQANLYTLFLLAIGIFFIGVWKLSLVCLLLEFFVIGVIYFSCNTVYDCPFEFLEIKS